MSVATCIATASGSVTCTISSPTPRFDLHDVLAEAQAVNAALSTASPMIIIAYGGAGGHGQGFDDEHHGDGGAAGQGGQAQMTTSVDSFAKAYPQTQLFVYFGGQGSSEHYGGKGGASTVVSIGDLSMMGASTENVLLCAGGGGGGSDDTASAQAFGGGNGGTATSSLGHASTGAGQDGHSSATFASDTPAGGGTGGANGVGGAGGTANSNENIAGKSGTDGMGGIGGPVHLQDGPSEATFWTNFSAPTNSLGAPAGPPIPIGLMGGQGGEGEYRDDNDADFDGSQIGAGGGGGGGYGGGGGGGGAAFGTNAEADSGGGGGGGGTYAAASTVTRVAPPYTVPSTNTGAGYVMIIFPES